MPHGIDCVFVFDQMACRPSVSLDCKCQSQDFGSIECMSCIEISSPWKRQGSEMVWDAPVAPNARFKNTPKLEDVNNPNGLDTFLPGDVKRTTPGTALAMTVLRIPSWLILAEMPVFAHHSSL